MTQDAKPPGMPDDDHAAALRERVRALEQTVQEQQSTIEQLMPSRRAILAGGAGLVGGAALSGQASAQSAAGQVGTSNQPVDVEAATLNAQTVNTDSASVTNQLDAGSVNTKELAKDRLYARGFNGAGPVQRLDNALSTATDGDVVYLENATYDTNRTISERVILSGTNPAGRGPSGTKIEADWTISSEGAILENFLLVGTLTLLSRRNTIRQCRFIGSVSVQGDESRIYGAYDGSVTFASGTSEGIIDTSIDVSVTDNGSNTVGDIA